jgi:hypothetical protein
VSENISGQMKSSGCDKHGKIGIGQTGTFELNITGFFW